MRPIILLFVVSLSFSAFAEADARLVGTWKAIPFKVNKETIEREETLVVTDEKYQRTLNGEKRSGSSQSMQVVRYGTDVISPCLDFGGESYKMQFSDDLKTLTLYGIIPGRRVGNGTYFAEVDKKPFCVYARQGDVPDNLKRLIRTPKQKALASAGYLYYEIQNAKKSIDELADRAKADPDDRLTRAASTRNSLIETSKEQQQRLDELKKKYNITDEEVKIEASKIKRE